MVNIHLSYSLGNTISRTIIVSMIKIYHRCAIDQVAKVRKTTFDHPVFSDVVSKRLGIDNLDSTISLMSEYTRKEKSHSQKFHLLLIIYDSHFE